MKKILAVFLILLGSCFVLYALMVLVSCFNLLSSIEFNSEGIGYSLGTLFGPLLLIAFARWMIRKGVKIYKENTIKKP
ncbi:MAG: hypothetical protein ABIP51_19055 [Bacteroidia bacterium]